MSIKKAPNLDAFYFASWRAWCDSNARPQPSEGCTLSSLSYKHDIGYYYSAYRLGQTKVELRLYSPLSIKKSCPLADLLFTSKK